MKCKYSYALPQKIEKLKVVPNWKCDSKCDHCAAWTVSELGSTNFLSVDQLDKTLSALGSLENTDVYLHGGEPLLNKDLPLMVDILAEKCRSVEIVTNGHIVNNEIFNAFKKNKNKLKVCVSVDGLGVLHDNNRGFGSFSKINNFLDLINSAGVFLKTRTVITRKNYLEIDRQFFEFLKEKSVNIVEIGGMYFNIEWVKSSVESKNNELLEWSNKYLDCRDKNGVFYNYVKNRLGQNDSWVNGLDLVFLGIPPYLEEVNSTCDLEDTCPYQNGLVIEPDGRVLRCPYFPAGMAIE